MRITHTITCENRTHGDHIQDIHDKAYGNETFEKCSILVKFKEGVRRWREAKEGVFKGLVTFSGIYSGHNILSLKLTPNPGFPYIPVMKKVVFNHFLHQCSDIIKTLGRV